MNRFNDVAILSDSLLVNANMKEAVIFSARLQLAGDKLKAQSDSVSATLFAIMHNIAKANSGDTETTLGLFEAEVKAQESYITSDLAGPFKLGKVPKAFDAACRKLISGVKAGGTGILEEKTTVSALEKFVTAQNKQVETEEAAKRQADLIANGKLSLASDGGTTATGNDDIATYFNELEAMYRQAVEDKENVAPLVDMLARWQRQLASMSDNAVSSLIKMTVNR